MIKGIDVSHYSNLSPQVLSDMVAGNQLYFNFIKATEGVTIQDEKFVSNWQTSRSEGMLCGAYHFFRPLGDPTQQANNFLSQYKKVSRNGVLPPVIDLEWAWVGKAPNQKEQWQQLPPNQRIPKIKAFLFTVEQELNTKPIIYTATNFWANMLQKQLSSDDAVYFAAHTLWIVDLKRNNVIPSTWPKALFSQVHFGESATTANPYDLTDQNEFNGSLPALLNISVGGLTIAKGFPKSNIVRDIQLALIAKQILNDKADGIFGSNTEAAVKSFQSTNGLVPNGIVDSQTWNKILA